MENQAQVTSLAGLHTGDRVRTRERLRGRVGEIVALIPAGANHAGRVLPHRAMVRWHNRISRVLVADLERIDET